MRSDTLPGGLACISAQFQFTPFATQRSVISGKQINSFGSLILSSLANLAVLEIKDLRDKKIGVGFVQGSGSFQLAYQVSPAIYNRSI